MRRTIVLVLALGLVACGSSSSPSAPDALDVDLPPVGECDGYACLACASGDKCADADTLIEGTCCAEGDSLVQLASGSGSEVVDVEANETYAILCGGFGAKVNNVSDPLNPVSVGSAGPRCQHAAFGPVTADGQVFYAMHHGDSWVSTPSLTVYLIRGQGQIDTVASLSEPGILYEGGAWRDGYLYVAAHDDGVRVYQTDSAGAPSFVTEFSGGGNAWKLALAGDHAFLADNLRGLVVVDVSDPSQPVELQTYATTGSPRDVDARDGRVYVALGGGGLDVFDASIPTKLTAVGNVPSHGSAQAVSVGDGFVSVAAWSHVAVYDTENLLLVGTERTRQYPAFEQNLGVAVVGDKVYVGEWEGMHVLQYRQGRVAPDLWIAEEMYQFNGDEVDAKAVLVRNRGRMPLVVNSTSINHDAFTIDTGPFAIGAGGAHVFELGYTPPGPQGQLSVLAMSTNDPDQEHANFQLPVLTRDSPAVNVGDKITDAWAFLDPSGGGQLSALEGKVTVLAYFALF